MKRLLAIVLCAFMLMAIMPMGLAQNAEAEEKAQNKDHLIYLILNVVAFVGRSFKGCQSLWQFAHLYR